MDVSFIIINQFSAIPLELFFGTSQSYSLLRKFLSLNISSSHIGGLYCPLLNSFLSRSSIGFQLPFLNLYCIFIKFRNVYTPFILIHNPFTDGI